MLTKPGTPFAISKAEPKPTSGHLIIVTVRVLLAPLLTTAATRSDVQSCVSDF